MLKKVKMIRRAIYLIWIQYFFSFFYFVNLFDKGQFWVWAPIGTCLLTSFFLVFLDINNSNHLLDTILISKIFTKILIIIVFLVFIISSIFGLFELFNRIPVIDLSQKIIPFLAVTLLFTGSGINILTLYLKD